jgi:Porin subfamily
MTRAQGIGSLAAIGSLTAMIALQTGLPAARADELQDLMQSQQELIANQQLLQQRIDQLAKAQASEPTTNEQQAAVLGGPVVAGAPSIAGSFPRSFLIPGTNTSIAFSGYIKVDFAEWFHGGGNNPLNDVAPSVTGLPALAGVPLGGVPTGTAFNQSLYSAARRQNFVFNSSAAESRLRVETRTPSDIGQVTTVLEFDFYGCASDADICNGLNNGTNADLPRLRLAYATVGGFLAGQAFIPVNDLDSGPETLDFGGDAGRFGFARAPWIGYTWQLPYGSSFQVAAVQPESGVYGPLGAFYNECPVPQVTGQSCSPGVGATAEGTAGGVSGTNNYAINPLKTTIPDLNLVFRNNQPWGHVQLGFVAQRLTMQDGAFLNQNFLGYGGSISASVKPEWFGWSKDNFGADFYAGPGLGHYANPSGNTSSTTDNALASNWGLVGQNCVTASFGTATQGTDCYGNLSAGSGATTATTAANARLVDTQTILQYGAEANYQHWWTPNLRTTISSGFQTQNIPVSLVTVTSPNVPWNAIPSNANALQYNRVLITAHANLIWSPVSFIDTGLEFVWGSRLTILGGRGSEDVLDYAFKVKF